ncbi:MULTISPECIES: acyclic terpene utilization AtuA family protein [unclassified Shinella]|uniref:acyclic terpene utilization AtuA family protein n=1 Tax=unclassified Shinella TaxID=2643062 RepID=UPI00225CA1EC|nr:acyclic terpene utilization AtuA family protein [Shinella sp. YE25]MDC7260134.1 DUF1446 domain-containing protein [Shinella sp. YE25]CAI0341121.1 ABC transporter substrate-binding protein [Rhizobiaceae bacterium]CAK7262158.1 ABC transporter substrate-binding protein [Shinella sp. WSC3-e]
MSKTIRIGGGSAYEGDHLDAAQVLAEKGGLDYLIFDCLSEKTISEAYLRRERGLDCYDVLLEPKLRAVLPGCRRNGTRIILNGGILDPEAAARHAARICRDLGFPDVKIAYAIGGDVSDEARQSDLGVRETGKGVSTFGNAFYGAHAYGGARPIVDALAAGADIVITARAGDSVQYLAPMIHEFGWSFDDWDKVGAGLGLGHLLECAGQVSGGYFADPGRKDVPDLDALGFPIAEVDASGDATITKVEGTGGLVTAQTCKEQLVYEIGDPANYLHADGVVDFTTTHIREVGKDRVRIEGTTGKPRPEKAKIAVAVREGYVGLGRIMYGGTGCYRKAQLAADVVKKRLQSIHGIDAASVRTDYVGVNALFDWGIDPDAVREVELRISGHFDTKEQAEKIPLEVSMLPCNGPAGASWGRPLDQGGVEPVMGFYSALMEQDAIRYEVRHLVS